MQIADDVDDALAGLAGCAPDLLVPNIGDPDGPRPSTSWMKHPTPPATNGRAMGCSPTWT